MLLFAVCGVANFVSVATTAVQSGMYKGDNRSKKCVVSTTLDPFKTLHILD